METCLGFSQKLEENLYFFVSAGKFILCIEPVHQPVSVRSSAKGPSPDLEPVSWACFLGIT